MRWRLIGPARHRRVPWRNGQGVTTEIAVDPPQAGAGERFRWRLSLAEVGQSGPFSDFAGYDRVITLIEGNGMVLRFDAAPEQRIEQCFEPFGFDGGWRTDCELIDGPIRDFNVMVDRELYDARVEMLAKGLRRPRIGGNAVDLLHAFAPAILGGPGWRGPRALGAGDTLIIEGEGGEELELDIRAHGFILATRLMPRG